eukprot:474546-Ditylum_brightwellii.AAC.1
MPQARKIQNRDKSTYDNSYDTDGDIGPVYESIEHKAEMGVDIEEESMPSIEEHDDVVRWAENPIRDVHTNDD